MEKIKSIAVLALIAAVAPATAFAASSVIVEAPVTRAPTLASLT